MLPKPFATVVLRFGAMVQCKPTTDETAFGSQRQKLEQSMLPTLIR